MTLTTAGSNASLNGSEEDAGTDGVVNDGNVATPRVNAESVNASQGEGIDKACGEGPKPYADYGYAQAPPSDDAAAKQAIDALIFSRVGDTVEAVAPNATSAMRSLPRR